ncbi:ion transporter [Aquimarina latercula]|uniref:ion transporter n=1 Tax=Aquimarina latercula TaxID=987 RepID=UPI000402C5B6|nr:ion transporter [Aquimarina latercula]
METIEKHHSWKVKLYSIVHSSNTKQGKIFNLFLFVLIIISVIYVLLESVDDIDKKYHPYMVAAEWIITILFSLEYILKVISLNKPAKYIFSFYGVIDLLSTLPLYLSYFFTGGSTFLALRALRLLRVFRILKLVKYMGEANTLSKAIVASRLKISIFIYIVLIMCIIMGSVMYIVEEGANSGFSSIPKSIYWTIVTITTVGYGDIAPATNLGQAIASFIMILGYGIIAIPTGIVTSEMTKSKVQANAVKPYACLKCKATNHPVDAKYCHQCTAKLE